MAASARVGGSPLQAEGDPLQSIITQPVVGLEPKRFKRSLEAVVQPAQAVQAAAQPVKAVVADQAVKNPTQTISQPIKDAVEPVKKSGKLCIPLMVFLTFQF